MSIVNMMKPCIMNEIEMIAMLNNKVNLIICAMLVVMVGNLRHQNLRGRIFHRYGDRMFIHMAAMHSMEMTIMEIVDMTVMRDGRVTARVTMGMAMRHMNNLMRAGASPDERQRHRNDNQSHTFIPLFELVPNLRLNLTSLSSAQVRRHCRNLRRMCSLSGHCPIKNDERIVYAFSLHQ